MAAALASDVLRFILTSEDNRAFPNLLRYHPTWKGINQNMRCR